MAHPQKRLFFIDNIRILLIVLVILHHLAITYGGAPGGWYYKEGQPDMVTFIVSTLFVALNQSFFPQYIGLFIIGIIAYRHNWFMRIPNVMGKFWLCLAIIVIVVLFPTFFALGGAADGMVSQYMGGLHWQAFAYAVWEQFVGMGIIIGLLVLFRKRLNQQGTFAEAMSASSYTAYIIHTPVLVFLGLALNGISLYPLLKFALVAPVAVSLCFLIGHYIRKLPLARRIL